ncbi:enhanced serine sensitivity protein SseB [Alloalcanivorax gelatiniphagus]|uniref:Enhanced serine sensitivity protein SseB n=2 Tax=Alloalcanivorax gelatiniphagus TaxID=1194167 RepID=A0ABY2XP65_9GAMM|nr:enhanced serine sensitivity protein SseB [Alloalcanivorax gelatiniphagus]
MAEPLILQDATMPDSPLLDALKRAAGDPAARPEFYRQLLAAEVFVIGHTEPDDGGQAPAGTGQVSIAQWQNGDGEPVIPFFTDLEALQRAIDGDQNYLALPARSLFEITAGVGLVLNPRSDHGKEFYPEEIQSLLEHGTNSPPDIHHTEAGTGVLLGQPSEYPTVMVEALQRLLPDYPEVQAAWLCLMSEAGDSPRQSLLVGLGGTDLDDARRAVGSVIADTAPEGRAVDLIVISGDGEDHQLASYLRDETTPFYERRSPSTPTQDDGRPWWRRLLGGDRD